MADTISTVQIKGTGWLINNDRYVPSFSVTDVHYIAIQDWITAGNVPASEFIDEAAELAARKPQLLVDIRRAYDVTNAQPVVVNLISYNGGFESAMKLDAAKRLAVLTGAVDVIFYDKVNAPQTLTIAEADAVIIAIATAYQTALATKQGNIVLLNNATTLAELPSV